MLASRHMCRVLLAVLAASPGCASEPRSTPGWDAGSTDAGGSDTGAPDAGVCDPGAVEPCYTGPADTLGVGICAAGTKTCNPEGTAYSACAAEVLPGAETCATPEDDDCDGQVNEEGDGCMCVPGSMMPCYSGPPGTEGLGICHGGMHTCNAEGTGYGDCSAEVIPDVESCVAPEDEDCDGHANQADDDCACAPGSTKACYTGPFGTDGIGICHGGTKTCNPDGLGYGDCAGQITPDAETCNTPDDENCNGLANEQGDGCVCFPGTTTDCYSGPPGTDGTGICHSGSRICNPEGTAYGDCVGEVVPAAETCNTPDDDNCNGITNESGSGCLCFPGTMAVCPYSGPPGTAGKGNCQAGTKICNSQGTGYGNCLGEVLPEIEKCNGLTEQAEDEDCDGQINEDVCKVVAISAGGLHSLALREDGTVWAWGSDAVGQLGDSPDFTTQPTPVRVVNMSLTLAITAGRDHSMALRLGGDVWTWGANGSGQLGNGDPDNTINQPLPIYVWNFTDVIAIAAGRSHSLARRADNTVWAWGDNASGQLGSGTVGGMQVTPIQVLNLANVTAVAAGSDHSLALRANGTVWTWGQNSYGQLGDGTYIDRSIPSMVAGLNNVSSLDGGGGHSLALRSDGTLWAWGDNTAGQLGDGSTNTRTTPTAVLNLTGVTAFGGGFAHSLAASSDNSVWAWGSNYMGQLGDGTTTDSILPIAVANLTAVAAIAVGGSHSLALRADGSVWAWGSNAFGQLGDGSTSDRSSPVKVLIP